MKDSRTTVPPRTLRTASVPTLRRLPLYLRVLHEMRKAGQAYASGTVVAAELQLDPIVVRKDLAVAGVVGRPRLGFPVGPLIGAIESFLGWTRTTNAVLCGAGSLGRALLGFAGFQEYGLRIIAGFDTDSAKIGTRERGIRIYSLAKMASLCKRRRVRLGILTVPADSAQSVADAMIGVGIRSIWNFTPVKLFVPEKIVVERVDLASSLAVLTHRLGRRSPRRSSD